MQLVVLEIFIPTSTMPGVKCMLLVQKFYFVSGGQNNNWLILLDDHIFQAINLRHQ